MPSSISSYETLCQTIMDLRTGSANKTAETQVYAFLAGQAIGYLDAYTLPVSEKEELTNDIVLKFWNDLLLGKFYFKSEHECRAYYKTMVGWSVSTHLRKSKKNLLSTTDDESRFAAIDNSSIDDGTISSQEFELMDEFFSRYCYHRDPWKLLHMKYVERYTEKDIAENLSLNIQHTPLSFVVAATLLKVKYADNGNMSYQELADHIGIPTTTPNRNQVIGNFLTASIKLYRNYLIKNLDGHEREAFLSKLSRNVLLSLPMEIKQEFPGSILRKLGNIQ